MALSERRLEHNRSYRQRQRDKREALLVERNEHQPLIDLNRTITLAEYRAIEARLTRPLTGLRTMYAASTIPLERKRAIRTGVDAT